MKRPADSLQVVCAVIMNEAHEILACKRNSTTSLAGKWEFPGGKIEAGESKVEAIKREIMEELGVCIQLDRELDLVAHQYASFHISLYPFLCEIQDGKYPQALEHECLKWILPAEADALDWAEADKAILLQIQQITEKDTI